MSDRLPRFCPRVSYSFVSSTDDKFKQQKIPKLDRSVLSHCRQLQGSCDNSRPTSPFMHQCCIQGYQCFFFPECLKNSKIWKNFFQILIIHITSSVNGLHNSKKTWNFLFSFNNLQHWNNISISDICLDLKIFPDSKMLCFQNLGVQQQIWVFWTELPCFQNKNKLEFVFRQSSGVFPQSGVDEFIEFYDKKPGSPSDSIQGSL